MRGYEPGGRFNADFETNDILSGIDRDLRNPVGTTALWYIWDAVNSTIDPIYDVGSISSGTGGRQWDGPFEVPVIRAVITQGKTKTSTVGYYNSDTLHLTFNIADLELTVPGVTTNPDIQDKARIIWKGEVYRPFSVQQRGIVAERYTILSVDCIQVMPEEMVNDAQFQNFAN